MFVKNYTIKTFNKYERSQIVSKYLESRLVIGINSFSQAIHFIFLYYKKK